MAWYGYRYLRSWRFNRDPLTLEEMANTSLWDGQVSSLAATVFPDPAWPWVSAIADRHHHNPKIPNARGKLAAPRSPLRSGDRGPFPRPTVGTRQLTPRKPVQIRRGTPMETTLVAKRLGARTAALYGRVCSLLAVATPGDTPARRGLRAIVINVLCGAYHDYRSEGLIPKGDLVLALRELPDDRAILQGVVDLISDTLRGDFDEEESEGVRWAAHVVAAKTEHRVVKIPSQTATEPHEIALTPREHSVFLWLVRYCEVYMRPPTIRELGEGCALHPSRVGQILAQLAAKGAVTSLGGTRGWIPTRAP